MAKRRKSCFCAIERDARGVRDMICARKKSTVKNLARRAVKEYGRRGKKVGRYRIVRTPSSNC